MDGHKEWGSIPSFCPSTSIVWNTHAGFQSFSSSSLSNWKTPSINPQCRICFSWPAGNQLFQSLDQFCPVIISSPIRQNRGSQKQEDISRNKIRMFYSARNFLLQPNFARHISVCLSSSIINHLFSNRKFFWNWRLHLLFCSSILVWLCIFSLFFLFVYFPFFFFVKLTFPLFFTPLICNATMQSSFLC